MSYDLMVFDPKAPPSDREGFMTWYDQQTLWNEEHNYENPNVSTPELRSWFLEMIKQFPAMNGPYASDDVDDPKVSDYSIGKSAIYVAFAWSQAEAAYQAMFSLAKKHKVGFFDVSADDGQVWATDPSGEYMCIHDGSST
jgi:hypothetical protein